MGPKIVLLSLVVLLLTGSAFAGGKVSSKSTTVKTTSAPTAAEVAALKQKSGALNQQAQTSTAARIQAELDAAVVLQAYNDAKAANDAAVKDVANSQAAKNVAMTALGTAVANLKKVEPAYLTAVKNVASKKTLLDTSEAKLAADTAKLTGLTGNALKTQQGNVAKSKTARDTALKNYNAAVTAADAPTNAYTPVKAAKDAADARVAERDAFLLAAQEKQIEQGNALSDAENKLKAANQKVTDAKTAEANAYKWASDAATAYNTAYSAYNTAQSATTTTTTTTTGTTSTTTSSNILFNDGKYPNTGPNECKAPLDIPCTDNCTSASGVSGRYAIPNNGRCSSTMIPRCFGNAVLRSQCCAACTNSSACSFWQHYIPSSLACTNCGLCYLYKPTDAQPTCVTNTITTGSGSRIYVNASTLGRPCPYTKHDPHFRGAHGTRFEFNGAPEKSYCLLTDSSLHVNMKMRGYYDTRTIGASLLRNGLAVRTWIRELGFVWKVDGVEHSFRLAARNGKSDKRDNGFLALVEYDGRVLPPLEPGESYNLDGGLAFVFKGYEQEGGGFFDVDSYSLRIADKLAMDIKLRPAHPLLQTPDDAQVHLNVNFKHVTRSSSVHGIMGQTYREGRSERAIDYAMLSRLLRTPFSADGDNGKGFLDGKAADYETSGVLSTDCGFSAFNKAM